MCRQRVLLIVVCVLSYAVAVARADNFTSTVIDTGFCDNDPDYRPASGQFVNNATYNDPNRALGAPIGGGTSYQNNDKVISLGAFGGQIVLAFDHDVTDDPANPFGLDAIVFCNSFWVSGDPNLHGAELAHIEIMPELNGNGVPGDDPNEQWYLIPGSHLTAGDWMTKAWPDAGFPPMWYPSPVWFPNRPDAYDTDAYELEPNYQTVGGSQGVLVNPNLEDGDPNNDDEEGYWGYAEYSPTLKLGDRNADNDDAGPGDDANMPADVFYTTPDDPFAVGMTRGAGGGDAIDIQWAVDPNNGWQPAGLTHFRYVRITTAVDDFLPALGEISPEIGAVADVRPMGDLDADQDVDLDDYDILVDAWGTDPNEPNAWDARADIDVDENYDVDLADYGLLLRGWQLYNDLAEPNDPNGQLEIKAWIIEGDFDPGMGYVVIKIAAQHTGTADGYRWFNGLRAMADVGGGLWVDPNDTGAVEIVQDPGTLVPGLPPDANQINTETDANTADDNWQAYSGSGQAVEYDKDRDTWFYDPFANFLDAPAPDDPAEWTFTAAQFPNGVGDYVDLIHLVILKKAGYDGTPVRIYLGGQWGLVGEAPDPTFTGLLAAEDPNAASDVKVGVLVVEPLYALSLEVDNAHMGTIEMEPDEPSEPPHLYRPGTEVTLTAVPDQGKSFRYWKVYDPNHPGDANYIELDANTVLHLTMDADWEVEAAFKCGGGVGLMFPLSVAAGLALMRRRR